MNAKCFIKNLLIKYEMKLIDLNITSQPKFIYLIDSKLQSYMFHVYFSSNEGVINFQQTAVTVYVPALNLES